MGYTLIISEKPTASKKIAEALSDEKVTSVSKRGSFYYKIKRKGKEIVVVPAVGHLFVLDEKNGTGLKWKYPVFEVEWKPSFTIKGNAWSRKYYDNILDLASKADEVVSACDLDIEGSTIAYNIIRFICNHKDGKRMRFSTLTKSDIVEAYENASKHLDFPQIEAGLTRHQVDWYFGINISRALTLALEHVGGYWVLSTGRVQGPTLKLLSEREEDIRKFIPVPFWELMLQGKINGNDVTAMHEKDKFWKKDEALKSYNTSKGKNGIVDEMEKKEQRQNPPFPFDLTTLQRESYSLFGYSPKQTLDIAQTLYEHALISYPRTSSQKLPEKIGYIDILKKLGEQGEYLMHSKKILLMPKIKPNEGVKDDPAHPSIFPTGTKPAKLNNYQKKVYDLIVRRFLAVFGEPALREHMRVVINVNGERYISRGIRTLKENWIEFYKPYARFKDEVLPQISKGDAVNVKNIDMIDKETQPPSRYSQASVLKEMETLGLGTKATRAGILQTLYDRGYIKEQSINVTQLGEAIVKALDKFCPEIVSVDLTKNLEEEMKLIEDGKQKRESVIKDTEKDLLQILGKFKENEKNIGSHIKDAVKEFEHQMHKVGMCPKCGKGELMIIHSKKTHKRFVGCSNYPKCSTSFPLPQHGFLEVDQHKKCDKCDLNLVNVRNAGRRPWRLCVQHGFEYSNKKKPFVKKGSKPAESEASKSAVKVAPKAATAKSKVSVKVASSTTKKTSTKTSAKSARIPESDSAKTTTRKSTSVAKRTVSKRK